MTMPPLPNFRLPKRFWAYFVLAAAVLLGVLPALLGRFGLHNDWMFLVPMAPGKFWWNRFDETGMLIAMARPLGALLLNVQGAFTSTVDDFTTSRVLAALLTLGTAFVLFRFMVSFLAFPAFIAVGFAASMMLLPAQGLYVLWATNLVPGSLTIFLAALTYMGLGRAWPGGLSNAPSPSISLILIALIALMAIYPPSSLYGLAFTALTLVSTREDRWEIAKRDIALYLFAMLFYFIIFTVCVPSTGGMQAGGDYSFALTMSLKEKIGYAGDILSHTLSLSFGPAFGILQGLVITILCAASGWVIVAHEAPQPIAWRDIGKTTVFLLTLFFISLAPGLLAKGNILGIRMLATGESIGLIVILAPIVLIDRQNDHPGRRGLAVFCITLTMLVQVGLSFDTLSRSVENCEREYKLFTDALLRPGHYETVFVSMRPRGKLLVPPPLPIEFGFLTTQPYHFTGELLSAAHDTGAPYLSHPITTEYMGGDFPIRDDVLQNFASDPSVLLIDENAVAAAQGLE